MTQLLYEDASLTESSAANENTYLQWGCYDSDQIQDFLRQKFRDNDLQGISDGLNGYTGYLRTTKPGDINALDRFLFYYLRNITKESLRLGVSLERFESYVPAVVYLMQSDSAACVDALLLLTEQILKYISVHRTSESNHLLHMAKDYIRDHISDASLNLEAVSDHVGLSRVYFCKLFHQMEGVNFNTYLKRVRIDKAKHLLLTTNMKVYEVSNAVGFSHAKYFGAVFKEAVGQTPVEFQRSTHE